MARPNKAGLDYYPMDVDIFGDEKLICLKMMHGIESQLIFIMILNRVYKNGGWYEWNERARQTLEHESGKDKVYLGKYLEAMLQLGLFNQQLFASTGCLSSKGIQERVKAATGRRKSFPIPDALLLVSKEKEIEIESKVKVATSSRQKLDNVNSNVVNVDNNLVNVTETPSYCDSNPVNEDNNPSLSTKPKARKNPHAVKYKWDTDRFREELPIEKKEKLLAMCDGDKRYLMARIEDSEAYWTDRGTPRSTLGWYSTVRSSIERCQAQGIKPKVPDVDVGELEVDIQNAVLEELRG